MPCDVVRTSTKLLAIVEEEEEQLHVCPCTLEEAAKAWERIRFGLCREFDARHYHKIQRIEPPRRQTSASAFVGLQHPPFLSAEVLCLGMKIRLHSAMCVPMQCWNVVNPWTVTACAHVAVRDAWIRHLCVAGLGL
eukprot:4877258-Amphidinium_carterae.1